MPKADLSALRYVSAARAGGVATLSFNRPDALNALSAALLEEFVSAVRTLEDDADVGALILRGEGRAFSAGVDLKELQGQEFVAGRVGGAFDGPAGDAAAAIRGARFPVIAAVHGFCFTGALELALHCDFIFATADAKFGDTHAKWGLRPTWGMSQNLARAVGVRRARELSFTARTFTGAEAVEWGLAVETADDEAALARLVAERAAAIADGSRGAVSAYKKLYRLHEENRPLEDALAAEVAAEFPEITDTNDRLARFAAK